MWATDHGVLFQGDCADLFQHVHDSSVDCVFADPPFNLKKRYGNSREPKLGRTEYLEWTWGWLTEAIRVLRPGGSIFVHHIPSWLMPIGAWMSDHPELRFRHWISISIKNGPRKGVGLYPAHYGLLYFTKGDDARVNRDAVRVPPARCRKCGEMLADWGGYKPKLHPGGVNLTDVWTDVTPVRHKANKVRLLGVNELNPIVPERAILLTTDPGDLVLDPFGGGGTTFRMAEKHGRDWIGFELGTDSCAAIMEGLEVPVAPNPPSRVLNALRDSAVVGGPSRP